MSQRHKLTLYHDFIRSHVKSGYGYRTICKALQEFGIKVGDSTVKRYIAHCLDKSSKELRVSSRQRLVLKYGIWLPRPCASKVGGIKESVSTKGGKVELIKERSPAITNWWDKEKEEWTVLEILLELYRWEKIKKRWVEERKQEFSEEENAWDKRVRAVYQWIRWRDSPLDASSTSTARKQSTHCLPNFVHPAIIEALPV